MINFKTTGKDYNGQLELELLDEPYKEITFYYEGMKMADKENEDGSMNMTFEYTITSNNPPKKLEKFQRYLGDLLLQIMEEQLKNNEVVYTGGVDDSSKTE